MARETITRVERGLTGDVAWHVRRDDGTRYWLVWYGPGSRLRLNLTATGPNVAIDHPSANDDYRTFKDANAAAKRFVAASASRDRLGRRARDERGSGAYTVQYESGSLRAGTHRFHRARFPTLREAQGEAKYLSHVYPGTFIVIMHKGREIDEYRNGVATTHHRGGR